MSSIALFSGVPGIYELSRYRLDGNPDPVAVRRHRIGLYSSNDAIRSLPRTGPKGLPHLTVTGTVDTCEAKYARAKAAAAPDDLIMMSGYCHYQGGAVVDVTSFKLDPVKRYARLSGERARSRYGTLVHAPQGWTPMPALLDLGRRFRSALLARDRSRLVALHDLKEPLGANDAKVLSSLLIDEGSPFAEVRSDPTLPMAIFLDRLDVERRAAGVKLGDVRGTICFCRTRDCSDSWPIASNDADNDPDRPYACTQASNRDTVSPAMTLRTRVSRGGWLAEPRRSMYSRRPRERLRARP